MSFPFTVVARSEDNLEVVATVYASSKHEAKANHLDKYPNDSVLFVEPKIIATHYGIPRRRDGARL